MVNSLNNLLSSASNAMGAHKFAMQLAGSNIENANTPGYSRKSLTLSSGKYPGYGVTVGSVMTYRSTSIFRSILGAQQATGFHDGRTGVLELVEPAFNDLDGSGVSAALDDFFGSITALAADPKSLEGRHGVLNNVQALARTVNTAAESLVQAAQSAADEAGTVVNEANVILKEVAALNNQIQTLGDSAEELIDQRNQLLGDLADKLGIQTVDGKNGMVSVFTASGQVLIDGDIASSLELTGGGSEALGLAVRKSDGSLLSNGKAPGGRIGGLFETRDVTIRQSQEYLDNFAFDLAQKYNAVHESGVGLDGESGVALFEPLNSADDAARSLKLSEAITGHPEKVAAAADPGKLPGDDTIAQQLLGLETSTSDQGLTFHQSYDRAAVLIHTSLNDARQQRDTAGTRLQQFEAQQASYSGVSLQEEMMALSSAERAFEAVSRVVNTANEMYDTMLRMV